MAVIPDGLYKQCDARLRERWTAISRAQERLNEAKARAYTVSAAPTDSGGGHGGGTGDALERKAISVQEAEEQLRQALAWDDVFWRLDRIFPPGTREGEAARYLYTNGLNAADSARAMGISWKTIWDLRNNYIINCALLAVQEGLVTMDEE